MTNRKKPGVAFWATVVLVVVLVGYPLSFGPACWWLATPADNILWDNIQPHSVSRLYAPIGWIFENGPAPIANAIRWYATCRGNRIFGKRIILIPRSLDGTRWAKAER